MNDCVTQYQYAGQNYKYSETLEILAACKISIILYSSDTRCYNTRDVPRSFFLFNDEKMFVSSVDLNRRILWQLNWNSGLHDPQWFTVCWLSWGLTFSIRNRNITLFYSWQDFDDLTTSGLDVTSSQVRQTLLCLQIWTFFSFILLHEFLAYLRNVS